MGIRYDNRKIRTNRSQASKEARDRRGLKRVQQYTTPRFPEISPSDYASISSQQHEWTYGDRYYKLAAKYYGDSELHWIIVTVNNITSRYDWPLDQVALSDFVNDKYDNPDGIHHYEINATSGDTTKKLIVASDTEGALPVTNYEHEQNENDNKRRIRLLDVAYIQQFTKDFERLIKRRR